MHALSQAFLDLLQLRPHAVASALALQEEPPLRDLPQMKMKPRNLKVSGLLKPRRSRLAAAKRPNSIRRVLSGWSVNANAASLSRIASRKRRASVSDSKPKIVSSA